MKLSGKHVLVTGGGGLIGSRIVHSLIKGGSTVKVLDNLSAYPFDQLQHFDTKKSDLVEIVIGDIRNKDLVKSVVRDVDIIFHEAAFADVAATIWNPEEDFNSNVLGTFNLLEAARRNDVDRFIFASSAAVYGEQLKKETETVPKFSENMKPNPISTYANSKLWGEYEILLFNELYGLKATALRYFSVYGVPQVPKKRSHSWVVAIFVMRLLKGKPLVIFGDGEQVRDFICVDDVAEATIVSAEKTSTIGKVINVGTGKPTSIKHLAEIVMNIAKVKVPITFKPRPRGDPFGGYADTTLMKKLLGWEPKTNLKEGIKTYYEWVNTNKRAIPEWL